MIKILKKLEPPPETGSEFRERRDKEDGEKKGKSDTKKRMDGDGFNTWQP